MSQIPHGPADKYCPMWRKPQSKVCHTCPWWTKVTGVNPNSKREMAPEMIDSWDCAIAWMPLLSVNSASETFKVAAQVQEMRNEAAQNNAQQAGNMAALNSNLIEMHRQTTQVAVAQVKAIQAVSAPSEPQTLIEHRPEPN